MILRSMLEPSVCWPMPETNGFRGGWRGAKGWGRSTSGLLDSRRSKPQVTEVQVENAGRFSTSSLFGWYSTSNNGRTRLDRMADS